MRKTRRAACEGSESLEGVGATAAGAAGLAACAQAGVCASTQATGPLQGRESCAVAEAISLLSQQPGDFTPWVFFEHSHWPQHEATGWQALNKAHMAGWFV